ncbi:MAG TPA: hypothetical protein VF719_13460, partial [Abditibacteriaceae bacterium]
MNRTLRRFLLLAIVSFCVASSRGLAAPAQPVQSRSALVLSADKAIAQIKAAEQSLQALENSSSRGKARITPLLPATKAIRRADGAQQNVDWTQLQRRVKAIGAGANTPRREVRAIRETLAQRRRALEAWAVPRDGAYFVSDDAHRLWTQLESTGQIRSGPTELQQWWANVRKFWRDLISKISKWIFGSMPNAPVNTPKIDERWLKFFFYSVVLSLLAVLGYLLWKSLGGRWGGRDTRREVRYLEGEDAELLLLPADE